MSLGSKSNLDSVTLTTAPWSPIQRVAFRFFFSYLGLSTWFWIFEFSDRSTALVGRPYIWLWRPMVHWIAVHLFQWTTPVELNFVHDTGYLYAQVACFLIVSGIATILWSILGRKQDQTFYQRLHLWMRIFLRYSLAYLMLHYGMDKVFLIQFPAPSLARLVEPFGDYSPSSLMWAFIGSSVPYTIFGGLAEIAGALFLLARRTTLLGALLVFAVMFNVTMMDFSYDVSVKLFCLNLLLMAAFLIAPDASRLVTFLILNRDTKASTLDLLGLNWHNDRFAKIAKVGVLLYLIVPLTLRDWKSYQNASQFARENSMGIYGLYEVTELSIDGQIRSPLLTDATRWRFLVLDPQALLTVKRMDDSMVSYGITYDATKNQLHLKGSNGRDAGTLTIRDDTPSETTFVGSVDGATLKAVTHRRDRSSFPLISRGFHWINESSYIR